MNTEISTTTPTPGTVSKTGIVLATMDEICRFAETVIASGMAPKGVNNAAAATIIIQMGMEVGLPPMASLQNIAAINGRPSIWGDAMLGVVRSTGELEEFSEWYEAHGVKLARVPSEFPDNVMAVCRVKRRGYDAIEGSFSVADAKRAKLWGKQGPWTEYTARMLKFRARSFALRDEFGDALRGLPSVEEQRDFPSEMRDVTPKGEGTPQKVITGGTAQEAEKKSLRGKATAKEAEAATPAQELPSRDEMTKAIKGRMKEIKIGLPVAETRCREAGLLKAGQTFVGTNDEELYAIYSNLAALGEAAEAPAPFAAIYENHTVTRSPEGAEKPWTMFKLRYTLTETSEFKEAVTFSSTIGKLLDTFDGAEPLMLVVEAGEKGDTIKSLELSGGKVAEQ